MPPAESNLFLAAVGELHRLYALYFVALSTGLRQCELIGLRWRNVHLVEKNGKKPYTAVREEIRKVEGKSTRLPPKSKHSRRDIPLDDETIAPWWSRTGSGSTMSGCAGAARSPTGILTIWCSLLRLERRLGRTISASTSRRR